MIPYISFTHITIGPVVIQVWGLLVAVGFLVGAAMAGWMARRRGLDARTVYDLVPWLALAGMVGGRLGHVLLYDPVYYFAHPAEIFAIWQGGLSIFGGLLGCGVVGVCYLLYKKLNVHAYTDVLVFGLPFGKVFGRMGCFLIHDHPGTVTDFVLGVRYPSGEVRHDLGLYLALDALVLSLIFFVLARKNRPTGTYLVVFSLWYGVTRFFLDFLRVVDVRYFGLTPGQYFSLLLVLFGVGWALWITKRVKTSKNR